MRIVDTIPHESMTISIFRMNDKFIVKFEAGPMEQAFKFSVDEVQNLENLKRMVTTEFIETTRKRFNEMFAQLRTI
jgi:hypothetical protein